MKALCKYSASPLLHFYPKRCTTNDVNTKDPKKKTDVTNSYTIQGVVLWIYPERWASVFLLLMALVLSPYLGVSLRGGLALPHVGMRRVSLDSTEYWEQGSHGGAC